MRVLQAGIFYLLAAILAPAQSYRLPKSIVPQHYKLNILTNLGDENDKFEFSGDVTIQATVLDSTQNITLHAKNLEILTDKIQINDKHNLVKTTDVDKENDFFTIVLKTPLEKDKPLKIFIEFKGKLEDGLAGYYRSSYMDKTTNERRYLAVTQFESTDARRAFPCFDEPAMKAKFTISIGHKDEYTAISNMNEMKKEAISDKVGWSWTHFDETVPMSTYLVAFMVSDFGYETAETTHSNITFRIWARKDALKQIHLAAEVGPKVLTYFENYFGIAYPLPKQDMVAIPDFSAGAMENWGLITYRETSLLYDPEDSSASSQMTITSIIGHELAHQWFGNLVTMKWWTDLWLNEGFATFMAAQAVDDLHPKLNTLNEEAVNNLMTVFGFDSLKSSHPISVLVTNPREIAGISDAISYFKGSYILRMMSLFLGKETLRQGVSKYLTKHRYQNAEQDDLWASLTEEAHLKKVLPSNLTVKTIMDTWTLQTGYPVLSVQRDYATNKAEITQKRYLRDVNLAKTVKERWWVPLTYTTGKDLQFNDTTPKHFLSDSGKSLTIDAPNPDDFLLFNIKIAGLYRVNYDEKNWKLLSDYLQSHKFHQILVVNRVQLLEDSAALASKGDITYDILFNFLEYLHQEHEYLPWTSAISALNYLQKQLKHTNDNEILGSYVKKLIVPAYKKFGNIADSLTDDSTPQGVQKSKLRSLIASMACGIKVDECVADARKLFADYMKDPAKHRLPKNSRSIISCTAIRHGRKEEWEFLWKEYLSSNVATVKDAILSSLGCVTDPEILEKHLERSLQADSGIRKQDFATVFISVANNKFGYEIAKKFFSKRIGDISKHLYPDGRSLGSCLTSLAGQMTTQVDYDWIERLTKENAEAFKIAQQQVERSLEIIRLNIQWQKMHKNTIRSHISKYIDSKQVKT